MNFEGVGELVIRLVAVLAAVFLMAMCVHLASGCRSPSAAAAESAYGAELLRCTDKSRTLAESKACERDVDRRWGVEGGVDGF